MKEPKLYYHLDKRSTTKDGRHPVKLVAYYKSKQSLISVGYYFTEEQWRVVQNRDIKKHKLFETSQGNSSAEVLNDIRSELDSFMKRANNAVDYLKKREVPYQASDIKYEYEKDHIADDELAYFKNCHIAYLNSRTELGASLSTISSYTSIYNTFTEYYESLSKRNDISKLRMVQIDARMLRAYKDHLITTKQDSQATVGVHYRYFRALFNYAISKGVIVKEAYPFGSDDEKVKIQAVKKTKKALTKEEFTEFINYRSKLKKAQLKNYDLAILSFLLNGANLIDIAQLTYGKNYSESENKITFLREKTYKSKNVIVPIEVPITEDIKRLIELYGNENKPENYIFKIVNPSSTLPVRVQVCNVMRAINRTLKSVAKQCGIREDLSYQFFRHTHATLSMKLSGVNIFDLMTSMGHSSIKTTQAYINSLPDRDDKISKMKLDLMSGVYNQ